MGFLSAYSFRLSPDRMKQLVFKKSPSCYSHVYTNSDTLLESLTQQEISHGTSKVSWNQRQPTGQLWYPQGLSQWTLSRGYSEMQGADGTYTQLSASGPDEVRRV